MHVSREKLFRDLFVLVCLNTYLRFSNFPLRLYRHLDVFDSLTRLKRTFWNISETRVVCEYKGKYILYRPTKNGEYSYIYFYYIKVRSHVQFGKTALFG